MLRLFDELQDMSKIMPINSEVTVYDVILLNAGKCREVFKNAPENQSELGVTLAHNVFDICDIMRRQNKNFDHDFLKHTGKSLVDLEDEITTVISLVCEVN